MLRPEVVSLDRARTLFLIALLVIPVSAPLSATISTETFFKPNEFEDVRMSPDGEFIAAIARTPAQPDVQNLVVMEIDTRNVKVLTGYKDQDVGWFRWVSDERLLFSIYRDLDRKNISKSNAGVYVINRDGSNGITLGAGERRDFLLDVWHDNPNEIVIVGKGRRYMFPDVYRVRIDKSTGRAKKIASNVADVTQWFVDHQARPRAAFSTGTTRDDLEFDLLYQPEDSEEWKVVASNSDNGLAFHGFDTDNHHMFVAARADGDKMSLFRIDPDNPKFENPIFSHEVYDFEGDVFFKRSGQPVFLTHYTDKPNALFFSQEWADRQSVIDGALSDTVNRVIDYDDSESRFLIYAYSDRVAGDFYLYDERQGKLSFLLSKASWLDPKQMAPVRPIRYLARDGLEIHGYLTLPVTESDEPVPLILYVHGGPYGIRDRWGFDREVQFLANRGYGVLQVNYRGSGGYGARFELDAHKKWGLEMQDDLTDAVLWAVEEGHADPARVCIYGGSYGGYATLMGLIKTPEVFRCGINYVGVSDLGRLHEELTENQSWAGADIGQKWFEWAVGHPRKDKERFYETSPINHVEKIEDPLLIVHGVFDGTVPVVHSRKLANSMKLHGKEYEYYEKRYEGHGFFTAANRIDLYNTILAFLEEHNAPQAGQSVATQINHDDQ